MSNEQQEEGNLACDKCKKKFKKLTSVYGLLVCEKCLKKID